MEHPILNTIRQEGFTPIGWFEPADEDNINAGFVILIGNVGPNMFRRFWRERADSEKSMDEWTRQVVDPLAASLDAHAVYPFDKPYPPFLSWARRGGAGHVSPLGLNIHSTYGLWHAYRAALLFSVAFDLPEIKNGAHPCETCIEKPCLSACPVNAFDANQYDVKQCGQHLQKTEGEHCMSGGCKARLACPIGKTFTYEQAQIQFHMKAFRQARTHDSN